jgi:hypothetical protein
MINRVGLHTVNVSAVDMDTNLVSYDVNPISD